MNKCLSSIENKLDEAVVSLMKKRKFASYAAEDEDFDDTNVRADKDYALDESKDVPGLPKYNKVNKQKPLGGRRNVQDSAQFKGDGQASFYRGREEDTPESTRNSDTIEEFYDKSYEDMKKHASDWINANDSIQKKYAKKFKPYITKGF